MSNLVALLQVFRNDYDFVVAEDKQQAIAWYKKEFGNDTVDSDDDFWLVDKREKMIEDVACKKPKEIMIQTAIRKHHERGGKFPCIIASTEY